MCFRMVPVLIALFGGCVAEEHCPSGHCDVDEYPGTGLLQVHTPSRVRIESEFSEQFTDADSCPLTVNGELQNTDVNVTGAGVADLRCSPLASGQPARPLMVFVGHRPGKMEYWMNLLTGIEIVGVNLDTDVGKAGAVLEIETAVKFFQNNAIAAKYGADPNRVILAGYSAGGIACHLAMDNLIKDDSAPWGAVWFSGHTRGKSWKIIKDEHLSRVPKTLIIQGTVEGKHGSTDNSDWIESLHKYNTKLAARNIADKFTEVLLSCAHHENLKCGKIEVQAAVKKFALDGIATPATTPTIIECSDNSSPYMWAIQRQFKCDTWTYGVQMCNRCTKSPDFVEGKYCQRSCFLAGCGYAGDNCGKCTDQTSPYMNERHLKCDTWAYGVQQCNRCNKSSDFVENKYCQHSCFVAGCGYQGDDC